jgi:hypothetical protein
VHREKVALDLRILDVKNTFQKAVRMGEMEVEVAISFYVEISNCGLYSI